MLDHCVIHGSRHGNSLCVSDSPILCELTLKGWCNALYTTAKKVDPFTFVVYCSTSSLQTAVFFVKCINAFYHCRSGCWFHYSLFVDPKSWPLKSFPLRTFHFLSDKLPPKPHQSNDTGI